MEYSWGATEVKASLPGVGAIVDITETGSSLRANNLRVRAPCFHISHKSTGMCLACMQRGCKMDSE